MQKNILSLPYSIRLWKYISIVFFLHLFSTTTFCQDTFQKYTSLSYKNTPISSILNKLEKEYDITFSFGELNTSKEVDFRYAGNLKGCLEKLFSENYIHHEIIGEHIILKYAPPKGRKIKGRIIDVDTKSPLIGATITVLNSNPLIGADSDLEGYFEIGQLPIGRYDFQIQYLGYEPLNISQILTTAGKELFLNLEMRESTVAFQEIIVTSKLESSEPINEFATASARSFSVEETSRFAASLSDPARMAQAYAGVHSGGDDLSNEIIIRGNATRGLLWRLEGVEVPNPNHFGGLGNGGGSVSMLSSSTLTNSDFYTGAFPAEYGNALSGVFDLRLRNGNSEKREHNIAIGNLGFEGSTEGYFKEENKASYLVNFRYSTIETFLRFLPDLERQVPAYRDLTFKINMPTKKRGTFSLFGLGGLNFTKEEVVRDSTKWESQDDALEATDREKVGVIGANHRYLISDKAYINTSIAATHYAYNDRTRFFIKEFNYLDSVIDESRFRNNDLALYFLLHKKINPRNKIRTGFSLSHKSFSYDYTTLGIGNILGQFESFFKNSGSTQYLQSYFQWQNRWNEKLEFNSGINFSFLFLNNTFGIDPRISLKYKYNPRNKFTFSIGLHSRPEHLSTYFVELVNPNGTLSSPNLNLKMQRAFHIIAGYDFQVTEKVKLKAELYYQYLFNIPVSENASNGFSVLNTDDVFDIIFNNDRSRSRLLSDGKGNNYGIDLTLERPFFDGYYFLFTASLFDSKYTTIDGRKYNTVNAANYITNALIGKEWKVGKEKKNIFGANTRFTYYGGRRVTPINLEASIADNGTVFQENAFFSDRVPAYIRWDIGISYKINTLKKTHTIQLDIQNVTNRFNILTRFYSNLSQSIVEDELNGAIPFFTYRVEF